MQIDPRWQPALRVMLLMVIFTMAGPEIFPAIEMATLLELLGAFLFVTAFWTALRMTAIDVIRTVGHLLVPAERLTLYRAARQPLDGVALLACISGNTIHWLALVVVIGAYIRHVVS